MRTVLIQSPCWTIHQPPLAIAYLSATLRANAFDVKLYDFGIELYHSIPHRYRYMFEMSNNSHWMHKFNETKEVLDLNRYIEKWSEMVLKEEPRLIGFSMYWTTTEISLLLAEKIKDKDPGKIIILGGPSCLKEERAFDFIKCQYVDIVVVREGETALLEIVKRLNGREGLDGINGTLIRKDGKLIDNGERRFVGDLNTIPFPDFRDFNIKSYVPFVSLPVLMSRGCIGRCTFCSEKNFWLSYRFRNAENIFEELKSHKTKYKIEDFYFVDSLINGNIKELSKLCDLIIEHNLKINWGGKARVDKRMTLELLKRMKKAGCQALDYGIESGSQKVVNGMHKDMDLKIAQRVIRDTYKAGIEANCFFIIGYPTETFIDFLKTVFFIIRNRKFINKVSLGSGCGIPPGSYLSKHLKEFNILMGDGFNDWKTKDGKNTYKIRKYRLDLLKKLVLICRINIDENKD